MTKPSQTFKFMRHMFVVALFGCFTMAPMPGSAGPVTDINGVYMANASSNCPSVTDGHACTATFAAVPSGHYLVISHVSCLVATPGSTNPFVLTLIGSQETFLGNGVGFFFDGTAYYQSTFSVLSVSTSGEKPAVAVGPLAFTTNMSVNCTIAGTLEKNPT